MPIEIKTITAETKPVQVGTTKDEKPVLCKCCMTHDLIKMAMIRGSAFELKSVLPGWFASLGASEILSHAQSESDGNLSVSVYYR